MRLQGFLGRALRHLGSYRRLPRQGGQEELHRCQNLRLGQDDQGLIRLPTFSAALGGSAPNSACVGCVGGAEAIGGVTAEDMLALTAACEPLALVSECSLTREPFKWPNLSTTTTPSLTKDVNTETPKP